MCIGEFTQTGATLQYYSIQIFDGTRSSQPDQQNLVSRKHGKTSGSQNLVFGKIKEYPKKMKLGLCLQLFKMRAKKFIISDGRSVWFGLVPLIFLNPD